MKVELIPIDRLVPYARNARTHTEAQVAQIAASIREYGFTNPVLIDVDGGIIAGHGRVMGARQLGLSEVPCLRLAHMSDEQKRAYIIADNKIALNSGWDEEILSLEMRDLLEIGYDIKLTGFHDSEVNAILDRETKEMTADQFRKMEAETDFSENTEEAFHREMSDQQTTCKAPIVPMYAEHHQAFVIVCDNEIDEAWIRNRLKLDVQQKSYKDQKIIKANVITVSQLRMVIK